MIISVTRGKENVEKVNNRGIKWMPVCRSHTSRFSCYSV